MSSTDGGHDRVADGSLERLRAICLAFPEAVETGGVGDPSFKVRDKIFAMRHAMGGGRPSLWLKAPAGLQETLREAEPARYCAPSDVGRHGWVGVYLDGEPDWAYVADLVDDSYRMTAPTRLRALLDER